MLQNVLHKGLDWIVTLVNSTSMVLAPEHNPRFMRVYHGMERKACYLYNKDTDQPGCITCHYVGGVDAVAAQITVFALLLAHFSHFWLRFISSRTAERCGIDVDYVPFFSWLGHVQWFAMYTVHCCVLKTMH